MPDAPDTIVANSAGTPAGFTVLRGREGVEYLACGDEHAEAYAVRVVTDGRSAIAGRVRSEVAASIPGVSAGAVAVKRQDVPIDGILSPSDRRSYSVVIPLN